MYLSRIQVDLSKVRSVHRLVMAGFPQVDSNSPRAQLKVLYRVDGRYILVQSDLKPDWSQVLAPGQWESKPSRLEIKVGRQYLFRATINPVAQNRGRRRYSVPIETWLENRQLGADLDIRKVNYHTVSDFSRTGRRLTMDACDIEGVLTVTDTQVLQACIENGLGRAKAYGCGLISLVPAS